MAVLPPQQPLRNPSPSSPFSAPLFFPSIPSPFYGVRGMTHGKVFGIKDARTWVLEHFVHKSRHLYEAGFLLWVVTYEFQVNVHAALWTEEVLYVIIWQKNPLSVGLSQHASAISSFIVADWPLHYVICMYLYSFKTVDKSQHRQYINVRVNDSSKELIWVRVEQNTELQAIFLPSPWNFSDATSIISPWRPWRMLWRDTPPLAKTIISTLIHDRRWCMQECEIEYAS